MMRFHRACRLAQPETARGWAGIAAESGYADQAHLVREFAALAGEPPTAWARRLALADSRLTRPTTRLVRVGNKSSSRRCRGLCRLGPRQSSRGGVPHDKTAEIEAPRIYPTLRCKDAEAMIRWLTDVFGFTEYVVYRDGGVVQHAELASDPRW